MYESKNYSAIISAPILKTNSPFCFTKNKLLVVFEATVSFTDLKVSELEVASSDASVMY